MRYIGQRSLKEALKKENATGSGLTNGQFVSQSKPPTREHACKTSTVSRYQPETSFHPAKEYMTGTRYVARIELLKRSNLCIARNDLGNTPGKPSIIQCKGCGAIIHLGPIDMGTNAFAEHLAMRHTAEECNNLGLKSYAYGDEEDANEEDSGFGGVDETNDSWEESTLVVDIAKGDSKD